MTKRKSAGILLYRNGAEGVEVFLVFPGGPFWANKDKGVWSVPKGEFDDSELPLDAAIREFKEETGTLLSGDFAALEPVVQKAGKQVFAWAIQGDIDAGTITSNNFSIEWPPRSGKWQQFPEVAKAGWFTIAQAREKINAAQVYFLDQLLILLNT